MKRIQQSSPLTTFCKWGEVFSDVTLANAILDRLIHHSSIIKITGPSSHRHAEVLVAFHLILQLVFKIVPFVLSVDMEKEGAE